LASKRYGPSNTVNPNGGQIFIEINFNTAQDYDGKDGNAGTISVNDKIQFYPTTILKQKGINGLVYMVTTCDSVFSKGRFEQTLDLLLVDETALFSDDELKKYQPTAQREANGVNAAGQNIGLAARKPNGELDPTRRINPETGQYYTPLPQTRTKAPTQPPGTKTAQDDAQPVSGRPRGYA
jgi:hypothetical protein